MVAAAPQDEVAHGVALLGGVAHQQEARRAFAACATVGLSLAVTAAAAVAAAVIVVGNATGKLKTNIIKLAQLAYICV